MVVTWQLVLYTQHGWPHSMHEKWQADGGKTWSGVFPRKEGHKAGAFWCKWKLSKETVPQIHLSPRPPAGLSLLSAETTSQVCEEWERGYKCVHFVMFTSSHPSLHGWLIYLSRGKTKTQKEVYKYTYSSSERGFFCKEELCCNGGLSFSALSK